MTAAAAAAAAAIHTSRQRVPERAQSDIPLPSTDPRKFLVVWWRWGLNEPASSMFVALRFTGHRRRRSRYHFACQQLSIAAVPSGDVTNNRCPVRRPGRYGESRKRSLSWRARDVVDWECRVVTTVYSVRRHSRTIIVDGLRINNACDSTVATLVERGMFEPGPRGIVTVTSLNRLNKH